MNKVSFNQEQLLAQKDMERTLWDVFWSYSQELGIEKSEEVKEKMISVAEKMISEFANTAIDMELYMDYPIIHLFLTSVYLERNFLKTEAVQNILQITGPDNNSKLAYLVRTLKENGVIWQ